MTSADTATIIARYRAGQTMATIAADLGIATATVHARLIDAGEPRRPRQKLFVRPCERREWKDLYAYGYGSSYIGKMYCRDENTILRAVRDND